MGELHLPRLRGAVGFIADSSWGEYGIVMLHDFSGQLMGKNAFNIGCRKQFGSRALPCSDTIDVVSHLAKGSFQRSEQQYVCQRLQGDQRVESIGGQV